MQLLYTMQCARLNLAEICVSDSCMPAILGTILLFGLANISAAEINDLLAI